MIEQQSFPRGKKTTAPVATKQLKRKRTKSLVDNDNDSGSDDEIKHLDTKDTLFGKKGFAGQANTATEKKIVKSKRAKTKSTTNELNDVEGRMATILTFKSLQKGMLVLGSIRQIYPTHLIISLPNRLNGIVKKEETSDELFEDCTQNLKKRKLQPESDEITDEEKTDLSRLFSIGQIVACIVLGTEKIDQHKKIQLSLRLSLVHSEWTPSLLHTGRALHASVKSVEDHGAIMNFGIRGVTAFLPSSNLDQVSNEQLSKGQILYVSIVAFNVHSLTATLSMENVVKNVTRSAYGGSAELSFSHLLPGMLLNCRVEEILTNGIRVNFLQMFSGTVSENHLSVIFPHRWKELYHKGLKGRARICYIDRSSKLITLSMAMHVVHLSPWKEPFNIGDRIDGAVIERIDSGVGMLLSLPASTNPFAQYNADMKLGYQGCKEVEMKDINQNNGRIAAYAHISNLIDGKIDPKLEKIYSTDANDSRKKNNVSCRVLGTAPFDGLVNVSCKPSSLSQQVLRHDDLSPGQLVKGEILSIAPGGILLSISAGVRGFVSKQHVPPYVKLTSDKNNKGPYQVGKAVEARVLRTDKKTRKSYLTMKKQLVKSEVPCLTSFHEAEATPGRVALGYITKIASYGIVVSFYNGVFGLVPMNVLQANGVERVEQSYILGQVVKSVVTRCDAEKKRLILSFDLSGNSLSTALIRNHNNQTPKNPLVGQLMRNLKVIGVEVSGLRLSATSELGQVYYCHLPFVQLTDFPRETALVDSIRSIFNEGEIFPDPLLVISVSSDGVLMLSRKPLLLQLASNNCTELLPSSIEHIKEHSVVVGFVTSVVPAKGIFVQFLNGLVGFIPKAFTNDDFVLQVESDTFEMGDTVICYVEKVDKEKKSFLLGFRMHSSGFHIALMQKREAKEGNYLLKPEKLLLPYYFPLYVAEALQSGTIAECICIGTTVKVSYIGKRTYGYIFTTKDKKHTVIVKFSSIECEEADNDAPEFSAQDAVNLCIVDYDIEKCIYYAIREPHLVESGSKKVRNLRYRLAANTVFSKAKVVAVGTSQKYAIVCLPFQSKISNKKNAYLYQFAVLQLADFNSVGNSATKMGIAIGSLVDCRVVQSSIPNAGPFEELALLIPDESSTFKTHAVAKKQKFTPKEDFGLGLPKYSPNDLVLGNKLTCRIEEIKEHSMELKLKTSHQCGKVIASVAIVDAPNISNDGNSLTHPFDAYNVHGVVEGIILAVVRKGANQRKPVSDDNPANFYRIHLSLIPQEIANGFDTRPDWIENSAGKQLLEVGKDVQGVIIEKANGGVLVQLSYSVTSYLSCVEASTDKHILSNFQSNFPVGKRLTGLKVLTVNQERKHVDVSLIRSSTSEIIKKLSPGTVVVGRIVANSSLDSPSANNRVTSIRPPSLMVEIGLHTFGRVCITDLVMEKDWKTNILKDSAFALGNIVECVVVSVTNVSSPHPQIDLTLRPDILANPTARSLVSLEDNSHPAIGQLVQGFVVLTTSNGCFIRLNRNLTARVMLRDLSDDYIKNPQEAFPVGTIVVGRVVRNTKKGLEISLKRSVVADDLVQVQWNDLQAGHIVKGTITKIQSYGVFVKIQKSSITGLCHISEIADEKVSLPLDQVFSEGDYVKAKILKIEERRLSLGLKPSYFEGIESSSEDEDDKDDDDNLQVQRETASSSDEDTICESDASSEKSVKDIDFRESEKFLMHALDNNKDSIESEDETPSNAPVSSGFVWGEFENVFDLANRNSVRDGVTSEEENDEENNATNDKLNTSRIANKQADEWIAIREKAITNNDAAPESSEDFERLLTISPQNSYIWIQYMAYHVSLTEVQLARDVAVRATSTVSFRDEKEKLNVWVAYMNLEHDFGDDDSFRRVFNRAVEVNNPKRVYLKLVDIYQRAEEYKDVEQALQTMQKKFKKSKQIWLRKLKYLVSRELIDDAAETLRQSLQSLGPHKHIHVILKYAQLMYDNGAIDKGRTIMEGVLANYPKRIDIWNVYLDKEIKYGEADAHVRPLFERLVAMNFSTKKMKFLFKKYLQFEQDHGTEDRVEHVKQLAKDFVTRASA